MDYTTSKFDQLLPSLCFIYKGPHWTQKCPKKGKINALLAIKEEEEEPKEEKR